MLMDSAKYLFFDPLASERGKAEFRSCFLRVLTSKSWQLPRLSLTTDLGQFLSTLVLRNAQKRCTAVTASRPLDPIQKRPLFVTYRQNGRSGKTGGWELQVRTRVLI